MPTISNGECCGLSERTENDTEILYLVAYLICFAKKQRHDFYFTF